MSVPDTRLDSLYEANAGRVYAYCFARAGSRNVAEWAVQATFDRARAALANGGIPDPELEWLLRTADKFCAPRLCLDAQPFESMIVLQDWRGRTFDEIANELEARYARLEDERNRLTPWRRLLGAFNAAPAVSWMKGLVGSLGVVKATAAGVAVLGAITVVGTPLADKLHDAVRPGSPAPPATSAPSASEPTPAAPSAAGGPASAASAGQDVTASARVSPFPPPVPAVSGAADMPRAPAEQSSQTGAGTGDVGGAAPPPAASRPVTRAGAVSASTSATTTTQDKPHSSVPRPTPTVPAVTAPGVDVPATTTPSVPTATLPSAETPSATVPSVDTPPVPNAETPTVPSATTPSVPSVSPPSVPSPPGVTKPTVTVPSLK